MRSEELFIRLQKEKQDLKRQNFILDSALTQACQSIGRGLEYSNEGIEKLKKIFMDRAEEIHKIITKTRNKHLIENCMLNKWDCDISCNKASNEDCYIMLPYICCENCEEYGDCKYLVKYNAKCKAQIPIDRRFEIE